MKDQVFTTDNKLGWRVHAIDAFKGFTHAWCERVKLEDGKWIPAAWEYGWIPVHALNHDYKRAE